MAMTAQQIADHALILPLIQEQSVTMFGMYQGNPRMASVFATQQRWLLGHAAAALQFKAAASGTPPMTLSRFLDLVALHDLASRNTADAFMKEMLHYGYAHLAEVTTDKRARPLVIAPGASEAIYGWAVLHLRTLDQMDGGQRVPTFLAMPGAIALLHPEIAEGLFVTPEIREPQSTFSLFTWLNNGGIIMDWLIVGLGEISVDGQRYPTSIGSVGDMATWFKLSRSHLSRKLREAEEKGSLGWTDKRGASPMWVSVGFVTEMIRAQAVKLAVIDAAYERCFSR